ncbi:Fur family transcriptional regulator [Ilyobacter polytropus]|uniref:Ferric uptake regulator, Fur family n=1 Tax=Ilyobacter polytropus (strain ATCC 51220 / DSM 2926 / LMG 16218 / CuHBu1) TaxID=572544 RepID=E3HC07_ILYPC|nr:Fur family transcriptional regulator [Ilyobacter polytropus]ADO84333.1 ferric uptake regulator, Fur family [Ilyobacter polytropus DSM 2926]
MNDVIGHLKNNGVKPSFQRIKIFEYLVTKENHPTVEMIYKELVNEIPTLSKTTVYNTLNLFVEKKIANVIIIEENETRYDAHMNTHGHFKCEKCKTIYDIEIDSKISEIESLGNFQIDEQHIYYKGICKKCLQKKKN